MAGTDEAAYARRVCLIEALAEDFPEVAEPPAEAAERWTEERVRSWFLRGGGRQQHADTTSQPGGGIPQDPVQTPNQDESARLREWHVTNKSAQYRETALAAGIPHRPDGLFEPDDSLLAELLEDGFLPFQKHLSSLGAGPNQMVMESWATGNSACKAGMDLRYFYKAGQPHGVLRGAVRYGPSARIGRHFFVGVHGGAVETCLDEATAELAKIDIAPVASTVEANFKIRKEVPVGITLLVRAEIKEVKSFRIWVSGAIERPDTKEVLATCETQLIDMGKYLALQSGGK